MAGNDILIGESGNDVFTGGLGADKFSCGPGTDTVLDFNSSEGDSKTLDCDIEKIIPPKLPELPKGSELTK